MRNGTWWAVLGLYAAAKVMEIADQSVFDTLGFTSGHTIKHLLAAAAALCLLRAVRASATGLASPAAFARHARVRRQSCMSGLSSGSPR